MPFKPVPRLRSFSYVGFHRYSLTICVRDRRRVFTSEAVVSEVVSQIRRAAEAECFAVIAYCFMPDHLHLLVAGVREDADLKRFVKRFKQYSSFAWKNRTGSDLWQRSYFEHVLRDEEDARTVARYIVGNPVRAGLVASPEAYPFSGSFSLTMRDLVSSL